jgi:pimeloyl-ACP methyl ester carboxylesterase
MTYFLKAWAWLVVAVVGVISAEIAAQEAGAGDERVELGGGLNGRWLQPAADGARWDGRVVLILHGFASDSEGPADSQRRLAAVLAARGIASLRVNFRGEGDAARTAIESTFDGRMADTETARGWVLARPGVAAERVGVVGWSLGGATALAAAGERPEAFRAVVLWSSVTGGDLYEAVAHAGLGAAAEEAEREGVASLEIAGWKTVTLRREFFTSMRGVDLDAALARHGGAFLSVRGSEDYLPAREAELLKLAKGRPAEAVLIGGGDHIFNVFEPGAPHFDRATEVTVRWLVETL